MKIKLIKKYAKLEVVGALKPDGLGIVVIIIVMVLAIIFGN
ncbi:hypothetical protein [Methanobacterium oryzae]